jgi:hypothetical protein
MGIALEFKVPDVLAKVKAKVEISRTSDSPIPTEDFNLCQYIDALPSEEKETNQVEISKH